MKNSSFFWLDFFRTWHTLCNTNNEKSYTVFSKIEPLKGIKEEEMVEYFLLQIMKFFTEFSKIAR